MILTSNLKDMVKIDKPLVCNEQLANYSHNDRLLQGTFKTAHLSHIQLIYQNETTHLLEKSGL